MHHFEVFLTIKVPLEWNTIFLEEFDLNKDFDSFFKSNERRIHYQIHRLGISDEWYEDFYSEGIIALWKAYEEYDEVKGDIGTFINFRIRYRLLDLLRKKIREQEKEEQIVYEESVCQTDGNVNKKTGMPVVNREGMIVKDDAFWEEVRSRLTENQWKWVEYFIIADLTIKEIMEIEGVSADAVKGWGRAVRRKLKDEELRKKLEDLI